MKRLGLLWKRQTGNEEKEQVEEKQTTCSQPSSRNAKRRRRRGEEKWKKKESKKGEWRETRSTRVPVAGRLDKDWDSLLLTPSIHECLETFPRTPIWKCYDHRRDELACCLSIEMPQWIWEHNASIYTSPWETYTGLDFALHHEHVHNEACLDTGQEGYNASENKQKER